MNTDTLRDLLDGEQKALRREVMKELSDPFYKRDLEWSRSEHRQKVREWVQRIGEKGWGALGFDPKHGGGGDTEAFLAVFETLAFHDQNLTIKFGVQFGLFAGSIHNLGTEPHHAKYLKDAGHARLPGCFAMTETGHGSNVAALNTEAVWDNEKKQFIINTPNRDAYKDYIGNAAEDAQLASVFAQLVVNGENHGVHAILVPIRDTSGKTLPGITIEDDGLKIGLNGVDNGRLAFDHIAVPRENLLNRFGSVDQEGNYSSPIESLNRRFFTMLGTLVGGRVSIAAAGLSASKTALTIAIRYAAKRRQFGPPEKEEVLLLDYLSHQRRLFPRLAKTYAIHFAQRYLGDQFTAATDEKDRRAAELLAAAIKPAATWHAMDTIQGCREACGGQGYLAENRFGDLKADMDVFTTFEGDNTVLLQLVAKERLKSFQKSLGNGGAKALFGLAGKGLGWWLRKWNPLSRMSRSVYTSTEAMADAFTFREERMLFQIARAFQKARKARVNPAQTIIDLQPRLLEYARAYHERLCFEHFRAVGESSLTALLHLFALDRLHADRGWYLENRYFSPSVAAALTDELDRLCREIRPHAESLIEAFGIPDTLLMAPISRYHD
ncbi:MAG: acyl-CoA oxidase [Verrucomicrobiales bacterium]|jgi:acyl-CoA oxidase